MCVCVCVRVNIHMSLHMGNISLCLSVSVSPFVLLSHTYNISNKMVMNWKWENRLKLKQIRYCRHYHNWKCKNIYIYP